MEVRYIKSIDATPLRDIEWTDAGRPVLVSQQEIDEWMFTGLNNRDFAEMRLVPPNDQGNPAAAQ